MTKKLSSRSALALLLLQVAACGGTAPKKLIRPSEDAGSDQGGASSDAGATSSAGTAGGSGKGGAAPSGGSGPDDAGAAGVGASGGDAGAADVGGGSGGTGTSGGAGASGSAGSAGAPPTCTPLPSSVITTAATAVHGDKGVAATVPIQTGVSYAWSVVSGPAAISGSATQNKATFDVGATGTDIVLQAVVTTTANACASTSTVHIPIPCAPPTLISLDHSQATAVPQYIPSNADSGRFDMSSSSNLWVPYLTKAPTPGYNATFDHFSAGAWGVPASSPAILNDPTAQVLFYKVATDNAGDAVFVWTQTTDNNNYSVMVAAYHVGAPTPWTTPQLVGTVFNQSTPVAVQIDRSTGVALIAWSQGPFGSIIPHLRTYAVSSNTLGTDTALRTTTTSDFSGDYMALALETNDALTGFAAWYEHVASTDLSTLYALHITQGVPDTVASAYDIQALAIGTKTFKTDVFNFNSAHAISASNEPRMIALSASGNAAVVWPVYNGLATGTLFGELYARRYTAGAWSAAELVATQGPSFYAPDWAIDDAGNVITVTQTNNVGFDFFTGVKGSAWSAAQRLANVNGSLAAPHIAIDASTGKGVVTYRDQGLASRAPLRGTFYDPTTHTLSPAFTIDDPQQSGGEAGRVRIDSTGLATVVFSQLPMVPPPLSTSNNNSLLFSATCK